MVSGGYHSSNLRLQIDTGQMEAGQIGDPGQGGAVPTREKQVDLVLNDDAGELERDLILRAQAGESAAFGELVTRYMRRAYFSALGFVGNHEDALDLSQEAFVRAYRARQRINPEMPFYTWLYQIIRRLCFNFTRDRNLRTQRTKEAQTWLVSEASDRDKRRDPLQRVETKEQVERVREAIDQLADREREVLVLKEFEGLRYREIAELLGIPIGTVMSRLYTARQHLAVRMEDRV
jgi:RNA polymerase sigma-70 factor (ECF subfamily)